MTPYLAIISSYVSENFDVPFLPSHLGISAVQSPEA